MNGTSFGAVTVHPSNSTILQWYETEGPTNTLSTGAAWLPTTLGTHSYTSTTGTNQTPCMLLPASFAQDDTIVMNALECKPQFLETGGNTIRVAPLASPNKIQVYLPSALLTAETSLRSAVGDWNAALPLDVQFEVVLNPCGSGPACITITATNQSSCGYAHRVWDPTTGLITGNMELRLHQDWMNFSAEGMQRTFAHELGHFLGMDNSDPAHCGISEAVMQDQFNCAAAAVVHRPTVNDTIPVNHSVYGGKTKASCGW